MARFRDVTHSSGVDFEFATSGFQGGGLAVADLDGDGLPEIVAGRRIGGLQLLKNYGELGFREVLTSGLDSAAQVTALAAVDLDNDGDRDLVVAGHGSATVMANLGDATFIETARFDDSGSTEHVLPIDLDGDGRLDLYFGNYDFRSGRNTANRLYLQRGAFQFTEVSVEGAGATWTTSALDVDADGDLDLYVANDTLLAEFGRPHLDTSTSALQVDLVLRNDGVDAEGVPQLVNIAAELGFTQPRSSMGGLVGDFDGDGGFDLFVPNWGVNKLFMRAETGGFVESAAAMGLAAPFRYNARCDESSEDSNCLLLSWSSVLADFDLDGSDEVVIVNGETERGRTPPVQLFTRAADGGYREVDSELGCIDWRGLVAADLDADGDQDLVVGPKAGPLQIFENHGAPAPGRWLRVELRGRDSNRDGVGAVVIVHLSGGRTQRRLVGTSGVIHSSTPTDAVFGLGGESVEAVEVLWPSGRRTFLENPTTGELVVDEQ